MKLSNYVVCKNVLGIQTNSKYIGWSFGHPSQAVSDEEINKCGLVVRLIADSLKSKLDELRDLEKFHYWLGAPGRDELFYERNFFAGTKLRLLVRGIRSERPEIFANKNYLRFIRFRFNNLHSPGYLLTDLVCALLLSKGLCPLHCSGFSIGDCTVAVIAPPDTGKTLTTMHAVLNAGASFLSEDLGITDGENFYACPWTSTFRYYDELSKSWLLRLKMKLMKVFPLAEFLPVPGECKTIEKYIDEKRIAAKTKITHIAILARRNGGAEVLDKERARQIILNLNRYEFMYMKSPMLTAYSYFNPEFNVQAMVAAEREILTKLANKATCLLVQSTDPSKFAELILNKLGE